MKKWVLEQALALWNKMGWIERVVILWIIMPSLHNAQNYFFQEKLSTNFNPETFKNQIMQDVRADRDAWSGPLIKERNDQINTLNLKAVVIETKMNTIGEQVKFIYENGITYRPRK